MNVSKIIFPVAVLAACMFSCKKDEDSSAQSFYYGKWHVREQLYTSIDTSYTESVEEGVHTYEFKKDGSVDVENFPIASMTLQWELRNASNDSILFGNGDAWQISEKAPNTFKAKFYKDSNSHLQYKLEK